jgi:hypothetical protein
MINASQTKLAKGPYIEAMQRVARRGHLNETIKDSALDSRISVKFLDTNWI